MRKDWGILILFSLLIYTSACKKNDPVPSDESNSGISGTVTIDTLPTIRLTGSIVNTTGYVISATNMASSYPILEASFESKPVKDSTYSLNNETILSIVTSSNPQDKYYTGNSGSIMVVMEGAGINISFTKVTFTNANMVSHTASGSLIIQ